MKLLVNGRLHLLPEAAAEPDMPLLWALRDVLGLTGTKFGCGVGACGACTVHVDGRAARACLTPLAAVQDKPVRTIEGLASAEGPHLLQQVWIAHQVPQCGYCQSGLLMAVASLLENNRKPSDADIDTAIDNLCRCGTTPRLRAAIREAAVRWPRPAAPKPRPPAAPRAADPASAAGKAPV